MRAVLIVCLSAASARADGFDWDPPAPARWELQLSSMLQGKPGPIESTPAPYAGFMLALEHRLDDRVWGGFQFATMLAQDSDENRMLLPIQTAFVFSGTARVRLARWVGLMEDEVIELGVRGELGNAIVTYDGARTTPILAGGGVWGGIGTYRTTFRMTMGWTQALAGSRESLHPGGIDVRLAVARNW